MLSPLWPASIFQRVCCGAPAFTLLVPGSYPYLFFTRFPLSMRVVLALWALAHALSLPSGVLRAQVGVDSARNTGDMVLGAMS